jgi:hypothetical protein
MSRPETLVVSGLMLLDYVLTILGARASALDRSHIRSPEYELNPLWREIVRRGRWLPPRHLALVALVAGLLVLLDALRRLDDVLPDETLDVALGAAVGLFGALCSRHLSNRMIFRYVNRHPDELRIQVDRTRNLMLRISPWSNFGLGAPVGPAGGVRAAAARCRRAFGGDSFGAGALRPAARSAARAARPAVANPVADDLSSV